MANLRPELTVRKFQRTRENFTCLNCGLEVRGNGYTNHCPRCLWSRHVDINPGDRASLCLGMMEPVGVEMKHGERVIIHRCKQCGFERRNKEDKRDNFEAVIDITK